MQVNMGMRKEVHSTKHMDAKGGKASSDAQLVRNVGRPRENEGATYQILLG